MKTQDRKTKRHQANRKPINNAPKEVSRSGDSNEKQVITAIQRHNQSPFPMLNRSERKLVQQHMIEELTQGFEHRRQALGMVLETKLHSIREACNHVLVTGKTHLRQQRLEYFGEVFRQVEQRMNGLSDDFLHDMDARFERLKEFKSEAIRKREKKRLEKSVDDFLDTLDQLMDEFRSIISEHISHSEEKQQELSQNLSQEEKAWVSSTPDELYEYNYKEDLDEEEIEEELEDEYGVNDVVEQFMEAEFRDRHKIRGKL